MVVRYYLVGVPDNAARGAEQSGSDENFAEHSGEHLDQKGLRLVLLTDLHNRPYEKIIDQVHSISPDLIAVAGDVAYGFDEHDRAGAFLAKCSEIASTYFSYGNHEDATDPVFVDQIKKSGATILDNTYIDTSLADRQLRIGGLSSFLPCRCTDPNRNGPELGWLDEFCESPSYKILLCHQPEYYPRYLEHKNIDLILSGHAHGGQWRIPLTRQGVFAPGQGIFPKLTGGITDNRLVISRGLSNTTWIPRFFNPREIVFVEIM